MANDKKDKGYDASMLRFVGNLVAGQDGWYKGAYDREVLVAHAIETAKLARKGLRKLQSSEEGA